MKPPDMASIRVAPFAAEYFWGVAPPLHGRAVAAMLISLRHDPSDLPQPEEANGPPARRPDADDGAVSADQGSQS